MTPTGRSRSVCYSKKKDGEKLSGAPIELDKRLRGVIGNLRARAEFAGDALEALVLDTREKIPTRRLLLIGLGDSKGLTLARMEQVGRVAYREAARLGANTAAFAPLVRDQGADKFSAADVERPIIRGFLLARDNDARLQKEGLADKFTLKEWVVEAGPAYFDETVTGGEEWRGGSQGRHQEARVGPLHPPRQVTEGAGASFSRVTRPATAGWRCAAGGGTRRCSPARIPPRRHRG